MSGFRNRTDLHGHDEAAGHVPHLVHHAVRPSAQLADLLQVIGLHLEILIRRVRGQRSEVRRKMLSVCLTVFFLF